MSDLIVDSNINNEYNIKQQDCTICESTNTIIKLEDNLLFIECLDCGCEFGNAELIQANIKLRKDKTNQIIDIKSNP